MTSSVRTARRSPDCWGWSRRSVVFGGAYSGPRVRQLETARIVAEDLGRARLQPCRQEPPITRASAPEGNFLKSSKVLLKPVLTKEESWHSPITNFCWRRVR